MLNGDHMIKVHYSQILEPSFSLLWFKTHKHNEWNL